MQCYYCHGYGTTTYANINGGIRPIHEKCKGALPNCPLCFGGGGYLDVENKWKICVCLKHRKSTFG